MRETENVNENARQMTRCQRPPACSRFGIDPTFRFPFKKITTRSFNTHQQNPQNRTNLKTTITKKIDRIQTKVDKNKRKMQKRENEMQRRARKTEREDARRPLMLALAFPDAAQVDRLARRQSTFFVSDFASSGCFDWVDGDPSVVVGEHARSGETKMAGKMASGDRGCFEHAFANRRADWQRQWRRRAWPCWARRGRVTASRGTSNNNSTEEKVALRRWRRPRRASKMAPANRRPASSRALFTSEPNTRTCSFLHSNSQTESRRHDWLSWLCVWSHACVFVWVQRERWYEWYVVCVGWKKQCRRIRRTYLSWPFEPFDLALGVCLVVVFRDLLDRDLVIFLGTHVCVCVVAVARYESMWSERRYGLDWESCSSWREK